MAVLEAAAPVVRDIQAEVLFVHGVPCSPNEYVWYAASKAAIDSLTIGLAIELAPAGIRVNAVSPGMTQTDIHALSAGDPGRVERIAPTIPLKRVAEPEEIAEAVLFALSEAASYMVGSIIRVGGGR